MLERGGSLDPPIVPTAVRRTRARFRHGCRRPEVTYQLRFTTTVPNLDTFMYNTEA